MNFLRSTIADAVTKSYNNKVVKRKPVTDESSRNVEEIIIPPEKK